MDIEGITAIVLIFGSPLLIGVLGLAAWTINSLLKRQQIERSRQTYERLARDKIDVIRTALAMGRSDEDIRDLDERLERLIGADQMKSLLDPINPRPPLPQAELHDADLLSEVERSRQRNPET